MIQGSLREFLETQGLSSLQAQLNYRQFAAWMKFSVRVPVPVVRRPKPPLPHIYNFSDLEPLWIEYKAMRKAAGRDV